MRNPHGFVLIATMEIRNDDSHYPESPRMIPSPAELWDAKRCAEFLGYSYDYFRKVVRYQGGVPQPIDRPGRERWLAEDWYEWARNSRKADAKAA